MDDAPMLLTEKGKPDTTARSVLQVLAEFARADGANAHPSVLRIQYRTGYDRRTVQRALRRLETARLIVNAGTVHDCVNWTLRMALRRPATDWDDLKAAEEAERAAAARRQRKARAKRVTQSDAVTGSGVTDSASARHVVGERDVTDSAAARHGLSAARTVSDPPPEPPEILGDGRRPSAGRGSGIAGGRAAPHEGGPVEDEVTAAAIGCVIAMMPHRLRDRLPSPVPATVAGAIGAELARGLTAQQLIRRIDRRWVQHGYESQAESSEHRGILRPVGVAVALVRAGDCPAPRCDDGLDLDTGHLCRTCERERETRVPAAREARQPVGSALRDDVPHPAKPAVNPTYTPPPYRDRQAQIQAAVHADRAKGNTG
ncbi:helix-turn-helix domain-containing protein [Streptomyces sp. WAC01280]|uniref:helix-turn-helix domain-containing protein n=1 Tax=Streptomyces sp. WAC01280 TaxID=2487424 RepID=UPI000F7B2467|nr:helix-turn-helix domain-containing protein [Streptomyces sp. WAC01280]RSS57510.1 helix-turn-helix domain-containing protein [Streptomyces sp. WAC01280]